MKVMKAGAVMKAARRRAGLSVREVSEKTGWPGSRVSKYENGHTGFTVQTATEYARALSISPPAFVLCCVYWECSDVLSVWAREEACELMRQLGFTPEKSS